MDGSIATTPAVIILVYAVVEILKKTCIDADKQGEIIPPICILLGILFECILFFISPDIVVGGGIVDAIVIGGMSGLATTGCNQVLVQYKKFTGNNVVDINQYKDNNDKKGD